MAIDYNDARTNKKFKYGGNGVAVNSKQVGVMAAGYNSTDGKAYYLPIKDGLLQTSNSGDLNVDSTSVSTEGLTGKVSGADFTTAYLAGTTITVASLPSYHATFLGDDIVTIVQIDNTGAVVQTYSRDDAVMTVAANVITVTGAVFAATDTFVIYTNINRMTSEETPTTLTDATKSVTTAGTAEALGASTGISSVSIKANAANTGNIYVGGSGTSSATGKTLAANDSCDITIANLATVFIDSDVDGEGVGFIYFS